jgi:hypothetical protein
MFELGVAVGMTRALVRLAIDLPGVFELLLEQLGDGVGANVMAARVERLGQLCGALRDPLERTRRVTHRRRLGEALEVWNQRRIAFAERFRAAALATHPAIGQRPFVEIVLSPINGGAREPGDFAHDDESAVAGGPHLVGGEQALAPLVELAAQRFPAQFDAIAVDHANGAYNCSRRSRIHPSRSVARPRITIHLSLQVSLLIRPGEVSTRRT